MIQSKQHFDLAFERRYALILMSLPIMMIGLLIVIYALVSVAWPPDYQNAAPYHTVSHWDRWTGDDLPADEAGSVVRESGYAVRRGLDILVYFMIFQAFVAMVGLVLFSEPMLYLPLVVSGIYGILYSVGLGIVIGPLMAAIGFVFVLCGALCGWVMTYPPVQNSLEGAEA